MGHMGASRRSPNDSPWETLSRIDSVGHFCTTPKDRFVSRDEVILPDVLANEKYAQFQHSPT